MKPIKKLLFKIINANDIIWLKISIISLICGYTAAAFHKVTLGTVFAIATLITIFVYAYKSIYKL